MTISCLLPLQILDNPHMTIQYLNTELLNTALDKLKFGAAYTAETVISCMNVELLHDNLKSVCPLKPHRVSMRIHYLQNPRWLSEEGLLNESKAAVPSEFMKKTFQAAQPTHERFLTVDHSCKYFLDFCQTELPPTSGVYSYT